jgi:hypothetical protein
MVEERRYTLTRCVKGFSRLFCTRVGLIDPFILIVERLAIYRCGDFEYKAPKPERSRQRQQ